MQDKRIPPTIAIIALILCIGFFPTYCVDNPSCQARQQPTALNAPDTDRLPYSPASIMPTRSQEAKMCRKEEEAMAKATLEREKAAAARQLQEEKAMTTAATGLVPPSVVSPPSVSNLNSLLTGYIGRVTKRSQEDGTTLNAMGNNIINDTSKPPKQKKPKKSKSSKDNKEDGATKREQRGSALKQSSVAVATPTPHPPAPAYKYEQVFYEAGLELKGEDEYGAYVKQIGNLLKNIQLVDPSTIMHAAVKMGASKPIGKKRK
jgi:hypothetical protein